MRNFTVIYPSARRLVSEGFAITNLNDPSRPLPERAVTNLKQALRGCHRGDYQTFNLFSMYALEEVFPSLKGCVSAPMPHVVPGAIWFEFNGLSAMFTHDAEAYANFLSHASGGSSHAVVIEHKVL